MSIVAHPEKHQVVTIDHLTMLRREKGESVLIFLSSDLRINLAAHAEDGFFRNCTGVKKRLACHAIIALRILRRHAALVAKSKSDPFPRKLARQPAKLGIDRPRRVAAGKGNSEFAPLPERSARLLENKSSRVCHKVRGVDNLGF